MSFGTIVIIVELNITLFCALIWLLVITHYLALRYMLNFTKDVHVKLFRAKTISTFGSESFLLYMILYCGKFMQNLSIPADLVLVPITKTNNFDNENE